MNWKNGNLQIAKTFPNIERRCRKVPTLDLHSTAKNMRQRSLELFLSSGGGVVISSYGLINSSSELFGDFKWNYLILDVSLVVLAMMMI